MDFAEILKKKNPALPYIIIGVLVFILFFQFFVNGHIFFGHTDRIELTVPFKIVALRAMQEHRIPQWNPYIFCGLSYLGSGVVNLFYPPETVLYLFNESLLPYILTISIIIHFLMAGFFAFVFLDYLLKNRYWAFLSSIAYLFSSTSLFYLKSGVRDFVHLVYLPLWLYLVASWKERTDYGNFILITVTAYLIISGGVLQTALYSIIFVSAYSFYLSYAYKSPSGKPTARPFVINSFGIAIAGCMCMIFILPLILNSADSFGDSLGKYKDFLSYSRALPMDFLRFFSHSFAGRALNAGKTFYNQLNMFNLYMGLPVALFIFYLVLFLKKREAYFWIITLAIMLLISFGTPVTYIMYLITGKSMLLFYRILSLAPICLAVLFGITGVALERNKPNIKPFALFSVCLSALLLSVMLIYYIYVSHKTSDTNFLNMLRTGMVRFVPLSLATILTVYLLKNKKYAYLAKSFLFLVLIVDLSAMAGFELNRSLPLLSKGPLFRQYSRWESTKKLFREGKRNFRFFYGTDKLPTSQIIVHDLYNSSGYSCLIPKNIGKLYSYPHNPNRIQVRSAWPKYDKIMRIVSCPVMISNNKIIHSINDIIHRVKIYTDYRVIKDEDEMLGKLIAEEDFDILKTLVLFNEPKIPVKKTRSSHYLEITEDKPEHVKIGVYSSVNCLLLLNDTFAPGWKAFIDSRETRILRANFAFRAIEVPKGLHMVEFKYTHPGFITGAAMSIMSCVIFLITAVILYKHR